ncbi:hypothetical protein PGT21_032429 [Puccinia graminis f. sp. tritici]|uniref:Uncharacterized protein n=1 Tax=Puccinia graminis f. sp. tritici TaxID=56615 RepID=A0A5B0P2G6_PUCGR|nr:hypothetical protein PGTUg99_003218 [Puccinia graminis f. sp. tritici]KAA1094904.1 hypothetical protein PGT21_032429 [Puccinia graminis f. sp. tritici]
MLSGEKGGAGTARFAAHGPDRTPTGVQSDFTSTKPIQKSTEDDKPNLPERIPFFR